MLFVKRKGIIWIVFIVVIGLIIGRYMMTRPIYIGFSAGLSGHWSQLGVQVRNGFLKGVEDINATGGIKGRKIIPVIMDDRNDNDYTDVLIEEMLSKKIDFFIGFSISSMTPSIEKIMDRSDIFIISPTMSTNALTGRDDNFFRVCNASAAEAKSLLAILKEDGLRDFAILHDVSNRPYTGPMRDIIVELAPDYGLNLVHEEGFNSKNVNYDVMIERLMSKGPKQIVTITSGVDTAEIVQRLRVAGSDAVLYAGAWATTDDLLVNGGKALEGMRVNGLSDISSTRESFLAFKEEIKASYGDEPTFPQIFGYESIQILKEGMVKANSFDTEDVKAAIIDIREFEGLQHTIEIDSFGDAHRPYYVYIVEDGQFKSLK